MSSTQPNEGLATGRSLSAFLEAIQAVTGAAGTLAVPTFNFGFARGEPYDPRNTPAAGMGAFSEYVRQRPDALRTPHPMQSLAVVGRWAQDLAQRDTASAFDPGSAFERMLELDFRLLLLGADIQAVSLLHYCEQKAHVPYRYWKEFKGSVWTPQGWVDKTYRMFVRDLDVDARIELYPVQATLEAQGLWASVPLNYGRVSSCRLVDFVAAVDHFLQADPWSLVTNKKQSNP
jgi:aminoglycoside N3'-acetyltransferase